MRSNVGLKIKSGIRAGQAYLFTAGHGARRNGPGSGHPLEGVRSVHW